MVTILPVFDGEGAIRVCPYCGVPATTTCKKDCIIHLLQKHNICSVEELGEMLASVVWAIDVKSEVCSHADECECHGCMALGVVDVLLETIQKVLTPKQ